MSELTSGTGPSSAGNRWKRIVDSAASIALVVACGVVVWRFAQAPPLGGAPRPEREASVPTEPLLLDTTASKGSPQARAVLVEFSDFECPFCRRFAADTLPQLEKEYVESGKVRFVYQHLPLPNHRFALRAAEAAVCAARLNAFWPMHDRLLAASGELTDAAVTAIAQDIELDGESFERCFAGEAADAVKAQAAIARSAGLTATPTFLLGVLDSDGRFTARRRISGAVPFEQFKAVIDEFLSTSK